MPTRNVLSLFAVMMTLMTLYALLENFFGGHEPNISMTAFAIGAALTAYVLYEG